MDNNNNKNYFNKWVESYSNSWKLFIQPKKYEYDDDELPCALNINENFIFKKFSFKITNKFCNKLQCHFYYATEMCDIKKENIEFRKNNCLIYLHSQSGNSMQGKFLLYFCIKNNLSLCWFDFQGCGNSEGEYISLGWNEKDDLELLVNHLRKYNNIEKLYLYGRSMGAVTAIFYLERNNFNVEKCIWDSPFKNLKKTSERLAKEMVNLPNFIINFLWNLINKKIKKLIGINIFEMNPKNSTSNIHVPVFLIGSYNDNLVTLKEINNLFNSFPKNKENKLKLIEAKHNENRDFDIIDEVFQFITKKEFKPEILMRKFTNNTKIPKKVHNYSKSPIIKKNSLFLKVNDKNSNINKNHNIIKTEIIYSDRNIAKILNDKKKTLKNKKKKKKNPIKYFFNSKKKNTENLLDNNYIKTQLSHNIKEKRKSNILNFNFYKNFN